MRNILLIGAGRSSTVLIDYLLANSTGENWRLVLADLDLELALQKIHGHPNGQAIEFNLADNAMLRAQVMKADLVISMLPANMHLPVLRECVEQGKHFVNASYVTEEIRSFHAEAIKKNMTVLCECGLDPGLDHMSAMQVIDHAKSSGYKVEEFKSYTGGLVAPESNDNPWGYKFSWNPRNVILAGQGTSRFLENGKLRFLPYHRLFAESEIVAVDGYGEFDGYANRDSLAYRKIYGLENIKTMIRGTLRQRFFCSAWNVFVQLGLTDDSYIIEKTSDLSWSQLVDSFLPANKNRMGVRERLGYFIGTAPDSRIMQMIASTGLLSDDRIKMDSGTPAQLLQSLLVNKWKLNPGDKDRIVMHHEFLLSRDEEKKRIHSSLVIDGEDEVKTAMAKTVGLPLAIAAKLILNKRIAAKGIVIPGTAEMYKPILEECRAFGISFSEKEFSAG